MCKKDSLPNVPIKEQNTDDNECLFFCFTTEWALNLLYFSFCDSGLLFMMAKAVEFPFTTTLGIFGQNSSHQQIEADFDEAQVDTIKSRLTKDGR